MQERKTMRRIREIIQKHLIQGLNQIETGLATNVSRGTVQNYAKRLALTGLSAEAALALGDQELESLLYPKQAKTNNDTNSSDSAPAQADWEKISIELLKKGVTLRILWEEYQKESPAGIKYSRFCGLYRNYLKISKLVMRQEHKPGETVYTDYSGDRPSWIDRDTGEVHTCELFVMCWGSSNYTYVEAHESQKILHWISAHVRAYAYFGCCPFREVIDNLKSGVSKACRYDPDTNPTYSDMSHHYKIAVIPARVRRPTDKAKVENAVLQSQRWILAKIRNEEFHSLDELNKAIRQHLDILNAKPMQGYGEKSRRMLFDELDLPNAQSLPAMPWVEREWIHCRAGVDYCVQADKRFYSVPYIYACRDLMCVLSERIVEIFCGSESVAIHERLAKPYEYSILDAHRPEKHRNVYSWTPERIRAWALNTGPKTAEYIQSLFASKTIEEEAYRPALGILRCAEKSIPEHVEKACTIALSMRKFRLSQFKAILHSPLIYREQNQSQEAPVEHENIRGLSHYEKLMGGVQ